MYFTKAVIALTLAFYFCHKAGAVELPSFVTAKARAACEPDVRRYCVKGSVNYNTIKTCIRKNWDKMSNDCQYEIVSILPQIEAYEKRKASK
jgi:hypothetical protein